MRSQERLFCRSILLYLVIILAIPTSSLLSQEKPAYALHHSNGFIWAGTDSGLVKYNPAIDASVIYTKADGMVGDTVLAVDVDFDGNVWAGTTEGLSKFDGTNWTSFTTADGMSRDKVVSVSIDSSGNIWCAHGSDGIQFSNEGGGLSRYNGNNWTIWSTEEGLNPTGISEVITHVDGCVWIVYDYPYYEPDRLYSVSVLFDSLFIPFTTADGLRDNNVKDIVSSPDGTIWFGHSMRYAPGIYEYLGGGVSGINNGSTVSISIPTGPTEFRAVMHCRVLDIDESNNLYGITNGPYTNIKNAVPNFIIRKFIGEESNVFKTIPLDLSGNRISDLLMINENEFYLATPRGIIQYRNNKWQNLLAVDSSAMRIQRVWSYETDPWQTGFHEYKIKDNRLFLLAGIGYTYLMEFDLTNIMQQTVFDKNMIANSSDVLTKEESYILFNSGTNLLIYDIERENSPQLIYEDDLGKGVVLNSDLSGDLFYTAHKDSGIVVSEITDSLTLNIIGEYPLNNVQGLYAFNNTIFVQVENELIVLDARDHQEIVEVDRLSDVNYLYVDGYNIYTLEEKLNIYGFSDVDNRLQKLSEIDLSVRPKGVYGNYLYVNNGGLQLIDISNTSAPKIIEAFDPIQYYSGYKIYKDKLFQSFYRRGTGMFDMPRAGIVAYQIHNYENISTTHFQFGDVEQSESSLSSNLKVVGEIPLEITDIELESENFMVARPISFPANLTGNSIDISVMFNPQTLGRHSAEMTIHTNSPKHPFYTVNLYGIGVPKVAPPDTIIIIDPDTTDIEDPDTTNTGGTQPPIVVIPETFKLYQNYPNPFNGNTQIQIDIAEDSFIKLDIYDIRGRHVRTLHQAFKTAGKYSVIWRGTDSSGLQVASGTYFVRLRAGKYTKTIKLLYLK